MKTKQLKQIKKFTSKTITQDIAAEICAILGLWKSYTWEKFKSKGFDITDKYEYIKKIRGGTSTVWHSEKGYKKTHVGVEIKPKCDTRHLFRIWADGHATCYNVWKKGDFAGSSPDKGIEYKKEDGRSLEYHGDQVAYVNILIKYGFLK